MININNELRDLFSKNEDPDYVEQFFLKYKLVELLGSGSFSSVFHVTNSTSHLAVKVLNKQELGR